MLKINAACHPQVFVEPRPRGSHIRGAAAAVELAVLLPFLGLAFAVTLDFCRAYHVTQTIQASAHAGALYASGAATGAADSTLENAAKQAVVAEAASLQPPVDPANVTVTITATTAAVSVSYDFPLLTPLLNGSKSLMVTRSVTMNVAP